MALETKHCFNPIKKLLQLFPLLVIVACSVTPVQTLPEEETDTDPSESGDVNASRTGFPRANPSIFNKPRQMPPVVVAEPESGTTAPDEENTTVETETTLTSLTLQLDAYFENYLSFTEITGEQFQVGLDWDPELGEFAKQFELSHFEHVGSGSYRIEGEFPVRASLAIQFFPESTAPVHLNTLETTSAQLGANLQNPAIRSLTVPVLDGQASLGPLNSASYHLLLQKKTDLDSLQVAAFMQLALEKHDLQAPAASLQSWMDQTQTWVDQELNWLATLVAQSSVWNDPDDLPTSWSPVEPDSGELSFEVREWTGTQGDPQTTEQLSWNSGSTTFVAQTVSLDTEISYLGLAGTLQPQLAANRLYKQDSAGSIQVSEGSSPTTLSIAALSHSLLNRGIGTTLQHLSGDIWTDVFLPDSRFRGYAEWMLMVKTTTEEQYSLRWTQNCGGSLRPGGSCFPKIRFSLSELYYPDSLEAMISEQSLTEQGPSPSSYHLYLLQSNWDTVTDYRHFLAVEFAPDNRARIFEGVQRTSTSLDHLTLLAELNWSKIVFRGHTLLTLAVPSTISQGKYADLDRFWLNRDGYIYEGERTPKGTLMIEQGLNGAAREQLLQNFTGP